MYFASFADDWERERERERERETERCRCAKFSQCATKARHTNNPGRGGIDPHPNPCQGHTRIFDVGKELAH